MNILVTGGAGFIGSNFIRHIMEAEPDATITNLDALTYAGNPANLDAVADDPRHRFVKADIRDADAVKEAMKGADAVVHFAAESHVDRSIHSAREFLDTNVAGTGTLLEAARALGVQKFVHVSTDEVYGSIEKGLFTEESPLNPSSPYSASKAGSDLLALSYHHTYGLPVTVTRASNNFGPCQFPEKLIPLFITNAMEGKELPIYGDGLNVRDWIYVGDHCRGVAAVLKDGRPGEVYNIGGGNEKTNMEITDAILKELGKPDSLKKFIDDRPGHDRRYALDSTKMEKELGWKPEHDFASALKKTIAWYRENQQWWWDVKSGAYESFYDTLYGERLKRAGERP